MLDAIIVIVQYARDQAVVSARNQALPWVSPAAPYGSRRKHICLESSKNGKIVWSYRITILRLPDNYNRRTDLQTSVGGGSYALHACMYA